MKAKTAAFSIFLLLLLIGAGVFGYWQLRTSPADDVAVNTPASGSAKGAPQLGITPPRAGSDAPIVVNDPLPGQGKVKVEPLADGGAVGGRVINWSTGEGVSGAELTFTSTGGAVTVRSKDKGVFELAADVPGTYSLTTIVAPNFLPYAPELQHSPVRLVLGAKTAVRGVTLFLFPAVDYHGIVVDGQGAPVAGAKVKLSEGSGEQTLEKLATEWTSDSKGQFVFHAADFGVLEASKNGKRGWAILDGNVQLTQQMKIVIGDAAARDSTIKGKTVDATNQPLANVRVTAVPEDDGSGGKGPPRALAFATSDAEGNFALADLDRTAYTLVAEVDDYARAHRPNVAGGSTNVTISIDKGLRVGGVVRDPDDNPIPGFTLIVTKRQGMLREGVATRTVIDPTGRFEVRVPKGDYELLVYASGWAPSGPVKVSAGTTDATVKLTRGATLSGVVVDAKSGEPVPYARVQREGGGGGASAQPANAGTVTRSDGTFELAGIPAGPFTISVAGGGRHPRLEGGLVATEGGTLGPIRIALKQLAEGEQPKIELVGIGVKLSIDGVPVTTLGMDGSVSRIRGVAGTTLSISILRDGKTSTLVVERKPLRF